MVTMMISSAASAIQLTISNGRTLRKSPRPAICGVAECKFVARRAAGSYERDMTTLCRLGSGNSVRHHIRSSAEWCDHRAKDRFEAVADLADVECALRIAAGTLGALGPTLRIVQQRHH